MIIINGSVTIRPDHFGEALKLGVDHSARSRAEPGSQRSGDLDLPGGGDTVQLAD